MDEDSEADKQMIQWIICPPNETLEQIPVRWKVIQTMREKFNYKLDRRDTLQIALAVLIIRRPTLNSGYNAHFKPGS
jgi:hypothetical protein